MEGSENFTLPESNIDNSTWQWMVGRLWNPTPVPLEWICSFQGGYQLGSEITKLNDLKSENDSWEDRILVENVMV